MGNIGDIGGKRLSACEQPPGGDEGRISRAAKELELRAGARQKHSEGDEEGEGSKMGKARGWWLILRGGVSAEETARARVRVVERQMPTSCSSAERLSPFAARHIEQKGKAHGTIVNVRSRCPSSHIACSVVLSI